MTTYYVKNGGNNALDGLSEANAWETIIYALTQMVAYDVLNITAGTYAEDAAVSTEHITLTGAGSGVVTINKLNLGASYPDVSGLTATLVISINNITNLALNDVVAQTQSTLTCANAATVTNCDFNELILPLQGDAASFTNTIIRCGSSYGLYIGVSIGANITFANTTILGTNPPDCGIQIPTGTNVILTNTTFEDPELAIKISSGVTATFVQENNKTFVGTVGTNTITPTESTLVVAEGTYDYRDFTITPDASIVISETSTWQTSGDQNKEWKVSTTGDRTVTFQLGDMRPNTQYDLKVDDILDSTETSDASGVITFTYSGTFSEKTFAATLIYTNTKRRLRKSS